MNRIETGPLQFGEDWPGLFLRGDDCLNYAIQLETLFDVYKFRDYDALLPCEILKNLLVLLKSANTHSGTESVILKPFDQCLAGNNQSSKESG